MSTSRACLNSGGFSGEFPTFRLLVVDDDPVWLRILERRLKVCQYEVTTCNRAEIALSLLRKNKNNFHLVISDVHMPDMDGFKLLELIVLEMNLPVIMMSADDNRSVIMKGVIHGAHDYLVKTVMSIETLKNIWQHVVRQNKEEWKGKILDHSGNVEDGEGPQEHQEDVEYSFAANEGRLKSSNKREEENESEERDDTGTLKKARVLWSPELHEKFVQAVTHLGKERAVPKKILELMNVPELKRENVASHLQKYRLHQKKNQSGLENAFMGHSEAIIGTLSNNLDLRALAPTGQLPSQNRATYQAATWGRPATKSPIVIPLVGQRNHFSFENPMLRYQGQQQMNNSNKQVNLPYGIPTTVEQFLGMNIPVARISHPQLRAQNMLSESNKVLSRNGIVDNARGSMYNQVPQASSSAVNFSLNQNIPLAGSSFTLSGNSTISATKEQFNSDYDNFSQLYQQKTQDWGLQNVGSIFDASMEHSGQNVNAPTAEAVLSSRQEIGHVNPIGGPQVNSVKAERYPGSSYQSTRIPEPFEQEDLMSTLLEQQQESTVGPVDNVFGLNDDAFEDLPM